MSGNSHIRMGGAPEGFDALLLDRETARGSGAVLHVARDDKRLAAMRAALEFFAPGLPVFSFPAWDCLPYDRVSPNADISATRMATLAAMAHGMPKRFVLLTTVAAATQRVPARETLRQSAFAASVGDRIDEAGLRAFLVRMGFTQAPSVMEPGDYAVRGGIMDVWPPGDSGPVRLDFFGDVLDGARRFDPLLALCVEPLERDTSVANDVDHGHRVLRDQRQPTQRTRSCRPRRGHRGRASARHPTRSPLASRADGGLLRA